MHDRSSPNKIRHHPAFFPPGVYALSVNGNIYSYKAGMAVVGISQDTFDSWREVLAPLKNPPGDKGLSSAEILALKVVSEILQKYRHLNVKVGALSPCAEAIFASCRRGPAHAFPDEWLLVDPNRGTANPLAADQKSIPLSQAGSYLVEIGKLARQQADAMHSLVEVKREGNTVFRCSPLTIIAITVVVVMLLWKGIMSGDVFALIRPSGTQAPHSLPSDQYY